MHVDREAEALGRAVIRWVGARKKDEFLDSIERIAEADERVRDQVVPIYVGVAALALSAIYAGKTPSEPQNQDLAEEIISHMPWDLVTARDVYDFLEKISTPTKPVDISTPSALITVFLVSGYIIAWYHRGLGYTDPYTFLDDLLNRLNKSPLV